MSLASQTLVLASSNAGKLDEFRALLSSTGFDVRVQSEFGLILQPEPVLVGVEL